MMQGKLVLAWAVLGWATVVVSTAVTPLLCKCYCCDTANSNGDDTHAATKLYTRAMGDGLGSVVTHVVHAAAIASKLGWKFMGACGGAGKNVKMHKANEDAEFKFMFGNASEIRPLFCEGTKIDLGKYGRPWLIVTDPKGPVKSSAPLTVGSLQAWARTLPLSQIYTFDYNAYEFSQETIDFFLDEPFLSTVRKSGECGLQEELAHEALEHFVLNNSTNSTVDEPVAAKLAAEKRTLRVVAHYRRGDIDIASGPMRASMTTHPSWYFHIMGAIKRLHPGASLRAFTSCSPTKLGTSQCDTLNAVDVPIWRQHGIELHVDDEGASAHPWGNDQATEEWKSAFGQWANADIFISARSSFSQSAAYFNGNCVLRNTVLYNKHIPLKRWIEIADPDAAGQDQSYLTKFESGLYKSHYNVTHLRVTGQDPTLHFIEQLRRALGTCLPAKLTSMLAEGEGWVDRATKKVICRPTEQLVFTGLPLSWQQRATPEILNDCTVLHLNGTSLAVKILPVLEKSCRRLEVVDLRGARVGVEGARALGRLLRPRTTGPGCPVLSALNLRGNAIGDEGSVELFGALSENSLLKVLDVQDNEIRDAGIMQLLKLLLNGSSRSTLVELRLSGNALTVNGSLALSAAIRSGASPHLAKLTCYRTATIRTGHVQAPPPMEHEETAHYAGLSGKYKIDDAWRTGKRLPCRFLVEAGLEDSSAKECGAAGGLIMQNVTEGPLAATNAFLAFMTNEPLGILTRAIRSRGQGGVVSTKVPGQVLPIVQRHDNLTREEFIQTQLENRPTLETKNQTSVETNQTPVVENKEKNEECAPLKIVPKITSAMLKEDDGGKSYNKMGLSHNESEALKAAVARAIGIYANPQPTPSVSSSGPDDLPASKTVLAVSVNAAYFKCKYNPLPCFAVMRAVR